MRLILKNCSKTLLAFGLFGLSPFLFGQLREGPTGHQLFSIAPVAVHPGFETDLTVTTNAMGEIQGIVSGMAGLEMVSVTKVDVKPPVAANTPPGRPAARQPMTTPANQSLWVIRVRIPNDAPTGLYDLRLTGTFGVSNPRMLMVRSSKSDQATERVEVEPNGDLAEALPLRQGEGITGSIQNPTDVDYFKVEAVKGQKLSFVLRTSSIDSRLSATLELFDPSGKRAASGRALFENDTILVHTPAATGTMFARLSSQAYVLGGTEAFYHLSLASEPVVQGIFPSAIEAGKTAKVTVYGWNLPDGIGVNEIESGMEKTEIEVTAPETSAGLLHRTVKLPRMAFLDSFEQTVTGPNGSSAPFLIGIAHDPVILDGGSNDDWSKAQTVSTPCEVAGWFEKARDRDWYRFTAKKGESVSVEILGDRLGSDLDLQLAVFAVPAKGKKPSQPLLDLDDNPEILHPQLFFSRSEDPVPSLFNVPENGDYLIRITHREMEILSGPRYGYRLRLGPQRPGFSIVAIPANQVQPDALNFRPGSSNALMLFVSRFGGFTGSIRIEPSALPAGISTEGLTLVPGQRQGLLLLSASGKAPQGIDLIRLRATARVGDQETSRDIPTASLLWAHPNPNNNQIMPLLVRLDQGTWVSNRDLSALGASVGPVAEDANIIGPGGSVNLTLKINRSERFTEVADISITGMPNQNSFSLKGTIANRPLFIPAKETSIPVTIEARNNIPPGVYNLSLRVHTFEKDEKGQRSVIDFSESIPVTFVPNRIFDVNASSVGRWRPGTEAGLIITVNRLSQYDGPVRVEVSFGEEGQGTVLPVEIAGDQNRIVVPVKLSEDLLVNRPVRLTIRSSAKIGSVERTAETRTTVPIVK